MDLLLEVIPWLVILAIPAGAVWAVWAFVTALRDTRADLARIANELERLNAKVNTRGGF